MNRKNPTLKRIFAVLIATVLLMSSVSVVFADDGECEHENVGYVPTTAGMHDMKCADCGYMYGFVFSCKGADRDYDGDCDACGYNYKAPAKPACDHVGSRHVVEDNGDGTHTSYCQFCDEPVFANEEHTYNKSSGKGACQHCGASCDHSDTSYDVYAETHQSVCNDCGKKLTIKSHSYSDGECAVCGYGCAHEDEKCVSVDKDQHKIVCADCGVDLYGGQKIGHSDANGDRKCDSCGYEMYTATDEEHKHNYVTHSNNDGTHTTSCTCGNAVTVTCMDNDGDGKCDSCGYEKYTAPEEEHEHNYVAHSNNNGTHTSSCACGLEVTITCMDNDGDRFCDSCGYEKYAHECDYAAGVTSNEDGTHNVNCSCGKFVKVTCLDSNGDGKCDSCGYEKYTAPEEEHEHNYIAHSNNDGTHELSCNCGKAVTVTCLDNDGDGKCDSCGYEKYTAPEEEHEHNYIAHSNNDGTHELSCNCGKAVTVTCLDNNGDRFCDSCGYEKYAASTEEHEHNYIAHSNNNGTHELSCNCGKTVTVTCLDNDGDRFCDSCGYEKYAASTEEHEHNYIAHSNNDGTHTSSCTCGLAVTITCLDNDGDRFCDSCGYEKYPLITDKPTDEPTVDPTDKPTDEPTVEPTDKPTDEPTDEPAEEPEDSNKGEAGDEVDVPKTGDSRADMMRMMLIACVILVSAGVVSALAYLKPGKSYR